MIALTAPVRLRAVASGFMIENVRSIVCADAVALVEASADPGPRVGEVLKVVYEEQLDGSVSTLDEAIAAAKRIIGS